MRAEDFRVRLSRRSFLSGFAAPALAAEPSRPNIAWIWGDNVAWADLGVYGNARARTPALTEHYAGEAIRFIRANRVRPFFLYVSHALPHPPLNLPPRARKEGRSIYEDAITPMDVWPLLSGQGVFERRQPFFWVYLDNVTAVRDGRWKLHVGRRDKSLPQPELYDVEADPGESRRLDKEHPDVVKRLLGLIQQYQAGIPKAWRLDYTVRDPRKLKSGVRKQ